MFILTNTSKTLTFGIVFLLTLIYNPKLEGKVVFPSMFSLTGNAHACWLSCDYRSSTGEKVKEEKKGGNKHLLDNDLSWPLYSVFSAILTIHYSGVGSPIFWDTGS